MPFPYGIEDTGRRTLKMPFPYGEGHGIEDTAVPFPYGEEDTAVPFPYGEDTGRRTRQCRFPTGLRIGGGGHGSAVSLRD